MRNNESGLMAHINWATNTISLMMAGAGGTVVVTTPGTRLKNWLNLLTVKMSVFGLGFTRNMSLKKRNEPVTSNVLKKSESLG